MTEAPAYRRWVVDGLPVVLTALVGLLAARLRQVMPGGEPELLLRADLAVGMVACVALWWRRRYPLPVGVGIVLLCTVSEIASVPGLVALFAVAGRCPARVSAAVFAGSLASFGVYFSWRSAPEAPVWLLVGAVVAGHAAVFGWGLLVRSRRLLLASLRERAAMAESAAALRAERTQHEAREALAREMHDVLGHRLSLLSVHAGALAFHRGAPAEETARAAEVVRENAHRALQDLREVIGVLRAPVGELPLPGITDVGELIEETRRTGTAVTLHDGPGVTSGEQPVPETAGRTAYRLVQEALTNARTYAPGAPVTVTLTGGAGDGLVVEVANPAPARSGAADRPGAGQGLRGLAERAALVGGRLDHGPTTDGGWRTGMRLPWPP
ncbi:sensor histidine kinase [Pseudonocardia sp. ICBG1293]|uniref:sensor histidine kinase n=1 Tax=Pseudonocardia sp. ICBG1293 TaxID=2844382 RepID=UPI001CCBE35C|nr:histidine kinase [Pseudonocardia sp. ICBG1293]